MNPENTNQTEYLQDKLKEIYSDDLREVMQETAESVLNQDTTAQSKLNGVSDSYQKLKAYVKTSETEGMSIYEKEDMETTAELMGYFRVVLENDSEVIEQLSNLSSENPTKESLEESVKMFGAYGSVSKQNSDIVSTMEGAFNSYDEGQDKLLNKVASAYAVVGMNDYKGKKSRLLQDRYNNLSKINDEVTALLDSESYSQDDLAYARATLEDVDYVVGSNKRVYNVHKKRYDKLKESQKESELNESDSKKLSYSKKVISSHGNLRRKTNVLSEKLDDMISNYSETQPSNETQSLNEEASSSQQDLLQVVTNYSEKKAIEEKQKEAKALVSVVAGYKNKKSAETNIVDDSLDDKIFIYNNQEGYNPRPAYGSNGELVFGFFDDIEPKIPGKIDDESSNVVVPSNRPKRKYGKNLAIAGLVGLLGLAGLKGCSYNNKIQKLQGDVSALVQTNESQDATIASNKTAYVQLELDYNDLEGSLAAVSNNLVAANANIESNKLVLVGYQDRLADAEKQDAIAKRRIKKLQRQVKGVSYDAEQLEGRVSTNENDVAVLQGYHQGTNDIDVIEAEVLEPTKKDAWYKRAVKGIDNFLGISQFFDNANSRVVKGEKYSETNDYINRNGMGTTPEHNEEQIKNFGRVWNANWGYVFSGKYPTGEDKTLLDHGKEGGFGIWNATAGNVGGTILEGASWVNNGLIRPIPFVGEPVANGINGVSYLGHRIVGGYEDGSIALRDVLSWPVTQQALEDIGLLADREYTSYDANLDGKVTIGDLTGVFPILSQGRQDNPLWNVTKIEFDENGNKIYVTKDGRAFTQDLLETSIYNAIINKFLHDGNGGNGGGDDGTSLGGGENTSGGVGGSGSTTSLGGLEGTGAGLGGL